MVAPGDLLQNRYRVLRPLGAGGFGQVFEVEDGGVCKVLKVLDPSAFQPSQQQKAIALFQREAEVLSQFHHPGVPQIEPGAYFVWPQPPWPSLHCLVMEKIAGVNLQQWRQQGGRLSQTQAIDWLKQLVQILAYLHQQQFFHRDIKPANIMLRPDGQLVLIDFGAVREMTLSYLVKQQQQETVTALVSAGYTPPEQAEGRAVPQSDFFALGRSFVYLLTGKAPIDLPRDGQTGQLLWQDQTLTPVSPLLGDLLDRLMAPFPGQRPPTCAAILQALQKLERHFLLQRWLPLANWWLQRRQPPKGDRTGRRANLWATLSISLLLTSGVTGWTNRLQISDTVNNTGLAAYESQNHQVALRYYQLALLFNPRNPFTHFNLGNLYEDRQQVEQARVAYQVAMELGQWKAFNNLAHLQILDQQYQQAILLLEQGLQLAEPEEHYPLLKNLGWAQLELKQYDAAEESLQQALELDPDRAAAHCLMAAVLRTKVKIPDALLSYDRCLQYADVNDPDDRQLSDLARNAFSPSEVQP